MDITGRVSIDQFSDSTHVEIKTDSDNTGSSTNDEDEDYRSNGDTGSQTDDTKENESNSGVTSLPPFLWRGCDDCLLCPAALKQASLVV